MDSIIKYRVGGLSVPIFATAMILSYLVIVVMPFDISIIKFKLIVMACVSHFTMNALIFGIPVKALLF